LQFDNQLVAPVSNTPGDVSRTPVVSSPDAGSF
jgi:hypothetical protein